ncbi:MAG TPA: FAD/NAD(P)-binding protein [Patescibacteria group bacterium]|nr:FAD/NAD(P)-binding protein [Patescibacteria group bacterium]
MSEQQNDPIVIVGGGLAGTTFLVHTLVKIANDPTITPANPVNISLIERYSEQLHGGVAYSKGPNFREHNLNAGARTLNFFPAGKYPAGMPTFVQYIEERAQKNPGELHALTDPPRQMVNEYCQDMLKKALQMAGDKVHVEIGMKNIIKIDEKPEGGATLHCSDGSEFDASHVVLATGFQEATAPKFATKAANHPHFVAQPYSARANQAFEEVCSNSAGQKAFIIGTGLTAMDIAARLIKQGFKGEITMMSRRALMHDSFEPTSPQEYLAARIKGEPRPATELEFTKHEPKFLKAKTVQSLVKAIGREFAELQSQGYTSGEILGYWERFVPTLAEKFPHADMAKLYLDNEALIVSRRAGVTPDTGQTVKNAINSGQIKVRTGAIREVAPDETGKLAVTFNPGRSTVSLTRAKFNAVANRTQTESFDFVFSAMGNSANFDNVADVKERLWKDLLETGKATPHWLRAGVSLTRDFSLVDAEGKASPNFTVIGVPAAGHMVVTRYPYPDTPTISGGNLGPTSLNSRAILSETVLVLDAKYDKLVQQYRDDAAPVVNPAPKKRAGGQTLGA